MDYKQELLNKIQKLLSKKYTVQGFEKDYYHYYLDQVPEGALSMIEHTFFGLVQENLDWTGDSRTEEDKKEGWFSGSEYILWLKKSTQDFQENQDQWYENYVKSFKK